MPRWWNLWAGLVLAVLAGIALLLNRFQLEWACRWNLCPEAVQLAEARQLLLAGEPESVGEALSLYRASVQRNPASAYRWCDLAEALLAAGQPSEARSAFEQAERLAPSAPQILLRAASFYLRQQEWEAAMRRMSRILALTPAYDRLIFSYYEKLNLPAGEILRIGVPVQLRPAQSYFQYSISTASPYTSMVWAWLGEHGFQTGELASAYVSYLLHNQRPGEAAAEWSRYLGSRSGDYPAVNRIYNGDFESEFLPSPFDWRLTRTSRARAVREQGQACSGEWSLRVDFLGKENVMFEHVSQIVYVTPGRYRFTACMKSDSLTTDEGVAVRIWDYESPDRFMWASEKLLGSSAWRRIESEIVVPHGVRLLMVQLFRQPSGKFDNLIAGTVWVDNVRLEPLSRG